MKIYIRTYSHIGYKPLAHKEMTVALQGFVNL
jgi:hypothetical protein